MRDARAPKAAYAFFLLLFVSFGRFAAAAEIRRADEPIPGRYIVALAASTMNVDLLATDLARQYDGRILAVWRHALKGFSVEISPENAEQLAQDKRVKAVEEDAVVHSSDAGSQRTGPTPPGGFTGPIAEDPLWHLTRISHRSPAPPANGDSVAIEDYYTYRWSNDGSRTAGTGTQRVSVYVIDTGVRASHAEFTDATGRPSVIDGFSAAMYPLVNHKVLADYAPVDLSPSNAPCAEWLTLNPPTPQNPTPVTDLHVPVHGTAVASMVVGRYVGVAKGAVVVSVNTLSCGNGPATADYTTAMLISGIDWAVEDALRPDPVTGGRKLSVVSMSTFRSVQDNGPLQCGSGGFCVGQPELGVLETALNAVLDQGIPLIASANNQRNDACAGTPARLSRRGGLRDSQGRRTRVITVGGTERSDERWVNEGIKTDAHERGSNYGQCVDIWAPGHQVNVAAFNGGHRPSDSASGTSYSAPIVAGIVARMLADDPTLAADPAKTPDTVWERLRINATRLHTDRNLGTGSPALLAYLGSVTFLSQPASQIVASGSTVTLSVTVREPSTDFQWFRGRAGDVTASTSVGSGPSISFTVCSGSTTGPNCAQAIGSGDTFWVRVKHPTLSGHYGDSDAAQIQIGSCTLPEILVQPESLWIPEKPESAFSATIRSAVPYCYEWQRDEPGWDNEKDPEQFVRAPGVTATGTGNATSPDGRTITYTPSSGDGVAYYRLVMWPSTACNTTGPCRVISETAQVRTCQAPAEPFLPGGTRSYNPIDSGSPVDQLLSTSAERATTYTWLYAPTAAGPFTPLQGFFGDGTWATYRKTTMEPPKVGAYKVRAENSCGSTVSTNAVTIDMIRDIKLEAKAPPFLPYLLSGATISDPTQRFRANCGSSAVIQVFPKKYDGKISPRRPTFTWSGAGTVTTTVMPGDSFITAGIYGNREVDVTVTDAPTSYAETIRFRLGVTSGQSCTEECTATAETFKLMAGQCSIVHRQPVYYGLRNGYVDITPKVSTTDINAPALSLDDFDFTWKITKPDGSVETRTDKTLHYEVGTALTSHVIELMARRRSGPPECDKIRIVVQPLQASCTQPGCTTGCKRRSVRSLGVAAEAVIAEEGQQLELSPDAQQPGETYQWYRSTATGSDEVFAATTNVTVTASSSSYFVVSTNAANESDVSAPLRVVVNGGAGTGAKANPAAQIVPAGALVTITAFIPNVERLPSTTYEWRRGNDYDATAPIVWRDSVLTLHEPPDDASYWCRMTHNGQVYDTNIASVIVTCTTSVSGTIHTLPASRSVSRAETPQLQAVGAGKLLTYRWSRRLPTETVGTFAGIGPAIRPTLTAPVTHFGVTAEDACGKTASFGEVPVYLCVPTIDTHPQSVTVRPGTPFTLSVAATPAIDGQPLTIQWYRTSDPYRTTPVGTGTTFTTTLAAGVVSESFHAAITSDCGGSPHTITSYSASIDVCAYPTVTSTSMPSITGPGQSAVLAVEASGRGELTYQWYQGTTGTMTTPIAGETTHYLTVSPATTTSYWCRVTADGTCSTNGPTITVPVCSSPGITTQPVSQKIFSGGSATMTVVATAGTNTEPLQYQWYSDGGTGTWGAVAGATGASYTTGALTGTHKYVVAVSAGACSAVSTTATISMCTYPAVVNAAPSETLTTVGEQVTLQLPAISPVYDKIVRWYEGESGNTSVIAGGGTLNASLTLSPIVTRKFWAQFEYDGCTSRTTTYTIRVCKPTITAQPAGTSVASGTAVTLNVGTTNLAGQTFQWYTGTPGTTTSPVAGATSASLTVTPTATTTYWVRVTGTCGVSTDSAAATVTVCVPPAISAFSGPTVKIRGGESTVLAVTASGSNLSYQWYAGALGVTTNPVADSNWQNITVTPAATTSYWVKVTSIGLCSTNTSRVATVEVCKPPSFSTQPQSQMSFSGKAVTLAAAASSTTGAVTYQWYTGTAGNTAAPIAGATAASLTVSPTATASYWVRATNSICTTDSVTATITMCTYGEVVNAAPAATAVAYGESVTLSLPVMSPVRDKMVTWYRGASGDRTNLVASAALNRTFTTPALTVTTQYWAEITEGGCASRTTTYTVSVCKPTITTQPASVTTQSGTSKTLTVATTAITGQTFQWYTGTPGTTTSPVAGATSASLTVTPSTTTSYWVRVTGTCGISVDSAAATITVCNAPSITSVSPTQYIQSGGTAAVNVTASGNNLGYQWYTGASGVTSNPIANSNGATILVSPTTTTTYWARVTSEGLCSTNSAAITVDACTTPSITTQPASQTIRTGSSATLSVATSAAGATYQWYIGSPGTTTSPIAGATAVSVTVTPTTDTQYWVRVTRGACSANSGGATLTVCKITATVANVNSASGQSVTLNASVTNARAAVYYTWYRGTSGTTTTVIGAGTGASSVSVNPTTTTNYWVRVSDGTCSYDSPTATVNVCIPTITAQPQNVTIANGQSTTLTVGTAAVAGQAYQWFIGTPGNTTSPISGATSASLTVAPTTTTTGWVRVTGTCGVIVDSAAVTITVCNPPSITSVSPTQYIQSGGTAAINVTASGNNLSYQWYTGASGVTTSPLANSNGGTILVSPATTTTYWARVTSEGLCSTNSPSITVDACTTPSITTQPASQTIRTGSSATLSVATSAAGATYQWYTGAPGTTTSPVSGATSSRLTVTPTADTQYWARVTRGACSANSNGATITVCRITASVAGVNSASGQSVTLNAAVANARAAAYYQWYRGNSGDTANLVSAGSGVSTLTVSPTVSTNYWVWVGDGTCAYNSATATVNVCVPTITAQPQSVVISSGQSTTLTVAATGAPLTYQWYIGDSGVTTSPISGATAASYTTPALTSERKYWVRVNGCSAANSNTAVVTVCIPPSITSGPAITSTRFPGNNASITITANGTNPAYQWYKGQSGDTTRPISGATAATYSFTLSTSEYYWVRVSACGTYVNSAAVMYSVAPTITAQPQSVAVPRNATATMSVTASGTFLSYQWYQGSAGVMTTPMNGATSATFTTPAVTAAATYWVKVTSGTDGLAYSNGATASICSGPRVTQFGSQYQGYNSWRLWVSIADEDLGNVKYQWYTGTPGNVAQSTPYGSMGSTYYHTLYGVSTTQTYWVRVWYNDNSCYSDTGGNTVYPVE